MGPGDRLGDPNLSSKFQTVSIIEVELFGKLYYTPKDGLIGVKLFSSEAGNLDNYKESLKGILDFLNKLDKIQISSDNICHVTVEKRFFSII